MRFNLDVVSLSVSALALVFLPKIAARPSHVLSTRTHSSPDSIGLRQHSIKREYHDTCAYIDADVLGSGILPISLDIDLCLCIGLLPSLVTADVQLQALLDLLGLEKLVADLSVVINDSPNAQQCTYPDHAYAVCSETTPCGFACTAPYVAEGDQCVCPAPFMSCNGVCGMFPHGCGSAAPRSLNPRMQKRAIGSNRHLTLAEAESTCTEGQTVCGIYGGTSKAFECLNTDFELESCGGCVVPNPFMPAANASGRDCTAIPGVNSVSCVAGECAITRCAEGWVPNDVGDACVKILDAHVLSLETLHEATTLDVQDGDAAHSNINAVVKFDRIFADAYAYALSRFLWLSGLSK